MYSPELLMYASMMHDTGKIGVPDHILLKPGKLTVEEFEVIKKHPEIGAEHPLNRLAIDCVSRWIWKLPFELAIPGFERNLGSATILLLHGQPAMRSECFAVTPLVVSPPCAGREFLDLGHRSIDVLLRRTCDDVRWHVARAHRLSRCRVEQLPIHLVDLIQSQPNRMWPPDGCLGGEQSTDCGVVRESGFCLERIALEHVPGCLRVRPERSHRLEHTLGLLARSAEDIDIDGKCEGLCRRKGRQQEALAAEPA